MSVLLWILLFSLLGGVLSVVAASLFLLIPEDHHPHLLPHGISFALGSLLSVAFLHLIPEAAHGAGVGNVEMLFATVLAGILGFFILEKLLLWRHCHAGDCETHGEGHFHQPAGTLIVIGDAIHNLVDGVLIAAAFLTDIRLGIVTALAVAAHEIPQEVGDFAILLQSGYGRSRALWYNLMSSLGTVVGGVAAYFALERMNGMLPYVLALAASSFIYVAVADLIPSLHRRTHLAAAIQQLVMIAAGIALIVTVNHWAEGMHPDPPKRVPLISR
ncbi:ZIP family metal transporter [Methylococcus sp. ANG]|uniref:ZIP family metal transporter n=1 Tax=unclassified Methylococcus TaxID=2618889 RepID=UPI001C52CC74|nr:ZIP family metal transporter [Methylococcus sp. Mc7]QXP84348.1 ZIP family metal transporter [Methylococcus sp. Mc7]